MTSIEVLSRYGDQPAVRERVLGHLKTSISHAKTLIQNLLDASQISVGKPLSLKMERVDLCQFIKSSIAEMTYIHGDRYDFNHPCRVYGLWAADSLLRVMNNLLDNALNTVKRIHE
jgi:signal transduction histidine kinase